MRKAYAIIASALLCAAAAQAQDAPSIVSDVTFSVEGQTQVRDEDNNPIENCFVLPSVDDVVKIELKDFNPTFDSEEPWVPYVVWTMGTGYAIDQAFEQPTLLVGLENTYGFTLNKEKWGNPSGGNYYVTVMVCFVKLDEEGEVIDMLYGADEEPMMFDVSYITPNVFPAEFQYAYPNGTWEDGDSFTKAYKANGDGCRFNFNNIVDFEDEELMGEIVYTLKSGDSEVLDISMLQESDTNEGNAIPAGKATVGYSPLDGNYVVSVHYWNSNIPAGNIASIEVSLMDMTSKGVSIENQSATISNDTTAPEVQKMPKSRLAYGLGANNESVTVYNMQGMLVKANVNKSTIQDLPAGLYIVDGKKVIVR